MKRLHVLRILSVLLLVAMSLSTASPAYAKTHYQMVIPVDDLIVIPGNESECGFEYTVHDFGYFRINYWLDDNGDFTKEIDIWGTMKKTISANGKTLPIQVQGPVHIDYVSETEVIVKTTGTSLLITVPGYGHVLGGAGMIVEQYTFNPATGEWDYTLVKLTGNPTWEFWGPLCEYLGP